VTDPPPTEDSDAPVNVVESMYDLIREIFVAFARQISRSAKIGDQFRMIQQCKELTPETNAQHEVWQLIELVRQEFHQTAPGTAKEPAVPEDTPDVP